MRAVVQRVDRAEVRVASEVVGAIGPGLLVYLGVAPGDGPADLAYLVDKVANLRIFEDEGGLMNRSVLETGGGLLVVSQFTLCADARKGRRPSYSGAAAPEAARPLYEAFLVEARKVLPEVASGTFQATMEVASVNDGPVTILLDSRKSF